MKRVKNSGFVSLIFDKKDGNDWLMIYNILKYYQKHSGKPDTSIDKIISELRADLELDKRLTYSKKFNPDNRLCEKCCKMMDLKKDRYIHHTENGSSSFRHIECPSANPKIFKEGNHEL